MMKYFDSSMMRFNKDADGFSSFIQTTFAWSSMRLTNYDVMLIENAIRSFHEHLDQNDVSIQRVRAILNKKAPPVCKRYVRLRVEYDNEDWDSQASAQLHLKKLTEIEEEHFTKLFVLIAKKLKDRKTADLSKLKTCTNLIRNGIFQKVDPRDVFYETTRIKGRFYQIAHDLIEQGYWQLKDIQSIFDTEVKELGRFHHNNRLKRFVDKQNRERVRRALTEITFLIGPYGDKITEYDPDNLQLIEIIKSYSHPKFILEDLKYLVTLDIDLKAVRFLTITLEKGRYITGKQVGSKEEILKIYLGEQR